MAEWINAKYCLPPVCKSVLLYVVDKKDIDYEEPRILVGFWSNDLEDDFTGFYLEQFLEYEPLKENINVIAWTLLPSRPQKGIELTF